MRPSFVLRLAPLAPLALLALAAVGANACATSSSSAASDAGVDALPAPICGAATSWTPGTRAFAEATAEMGLTGAVGYRVTSVDYDGDGWADLFVRLGGAADDFAGKRTSFLMHNVKGHFTDVTVASGIRARRDGNAAIGHPGEVVAFGDVDNDGHVDMFVGVTTDGKDPETSDLYLGNGDGTFRLGPAGNPFRRASDAVGGASFVDFDRDGNLDLWVAASDLGSEAQQSHLYQGDGAGNFTDVTRGMGLTTKPWTAPDADLNLALGHAWGWSANACDLDGDGTPELLAGSYARSPNLLWRAPGPGEPFVNQSVASGYAFDGKQDWRDNESARCYCKLNPTAQDCAGVPPPAFIPCAVAADAFRWNHATDRNAARLGGNSATAICADLDNDGLVDLVTCEIKHWDVGSSSDEAEVAFNTGKSPLSFDRVGNDKTGLARKHPTSGWDEGIMTGSVFDFDNDGWPDIYWGNSDYPGARGLLYHQKAPRSFEAVPIADGIDHLRSHGSAVADFDHDGDLDIVVGHSSARCDKDCYPTQQARLFSNQMGGNFVSLRLVGSEGTNRMAIGARVTIEAGGIKQTRDVGGGFGHFGQGDDFAIQVGLGAACTAKVTVRWPDANLTQESFEVSAGYRFVVKQGHAPELEK
jgi:hypothetical protein